MATRQQARIKLNAVELIPSCDDAIDVGSDYAAYIETLDPSKLKFKPGLQPTRFLLNMEFTGKDATSVKNSILGGRDDDGAPKLALGSWSFRVAEMALKDILYQPDVPLEEQFKMRKNEKGNAHEDLLADLDRYGIIQDIFSVYTTHVMTAAKAATKNS